MPNSTFRKSFGWEGGRRGIDPFQSQQWLPADVKAFPVPRPVRLTWLGKLELGFAALFLIMGGAAGVAAIWFGQRDFAVRRILGKEGVTVAARIVRKWEVHSMTGGRIPHPTTTYYVQYTFTGPGRVAFQHETYQRTATIPQNVYVKLRARDYVPVSFATSDPTMNRLPFENPSAYWVLAIFAVILLFFWRLATSPARHQKKLLARGQAAEATVMEVIRKRGTWAIRYRFRNQAGEEFVGRASFAGFKPLNAGEGVTVVYDEKRPKRNMLYPAPLAQLDVQS
jgi:hypothetical protein